MWEAFKILLLCLISIFIATLTASWLYTCVILLVLVVLLHDFDFSTGLERHAITKLKYSYLKVRNLYAAIFRPEQDIINFQYTPTMNSVNKQTTSFELSRFNKSGNALSPISNSSNSGAFSSRRLIQSRQTSTPLTRTSPWQKNSTSPVTNQIRTPAFHSSVTNRSPRYSLSSFTPKSESIESPVRPTIQTVTGPLLASTRFNVNLGTYTDTKSPGLASRVVQYHNELSGNQTSTHQTKYGSPGQFPIVQLYKRELPILNRPSRRCTVRIAPPDPVSYNSDHANAILRESFVQNNVENGNRQSDTEINTRSVLEALKEISRKRIHTNDDLEDISKRQRKNSVSSSSSSSFNLNKDGKRMREETPPKPKESCATPINSAPKRICVVNEIESSLSSSRLMRLQQGQKRKSSLNIPESNKQRRISNGELITRETQTTITNNSKSSSSQNINKISQKTTAAQTENETGNGMIDIQLILDSTKRKPKPNEIRSIKDIDEENSTLQFAKSNNVRTKSIFSEAPLEIMKQNKLSVMLSALGGNEPEIIPLPDMTLSALKKKSEDNPDGTDIINKEVVSILSPKHKIKHDKHVTFAIPQTDSTINTSLSTSLKHNETVSKSNSLPNIPVIAPISTSNITTSNPNISAPNASFSVPSTSINFSSPITFGTPSLQANISNPPAYSAVSTTGINLSTPSTIGNNLMFGSVSPQAAKLNINSVTTTTNSTNIITSSSENPANKNVINFGSAAPNFNFGSNDSAKSSSFGGLVPSSISGTKSSELNQNSSVTTASSGFQFTSTPTAPSSGPIVFSSPVPNSSVTFTPLPSSTSSQPALTFGAKSSAFAINPNPITTSTTAINFTTGSNQSSALLPTNSSFTAPVPVINSTPNNSMFSFGAKTEEKTSTSSSFSFGSPAPTVQSPAKTGGFKFDLGKSVATTSASSKNELPKPPMFGATGSTNLSKSFSFGASSTATTLPSAFSTPSTTNSTPVFAIQSTTTSNPSFGATNKTGSTNMFGAPSTSSNTAVFVPPNTTSSTGVFGTTIATTNAVAFGAPGTTLSSGTFGTPSTTTSTAVFSNVASSNTGIFGTVASSSTAFGTPKSSENAPGFSSFGASGSTQNPGFASQNSSTFGFGTATTQNNAFGGTPAATTQNNAFGGTPAATTQNNAFGGTPATTTQNNAFGSTPATTTNSFTFGSNTSTKAFSFGPTTTATTTASNMFGSTSAAPSTNLFGGNASSGFGSASGTPASFGTATTTAQSNFAQQSSSSSGVFGTASSNFASGTSGAVFGANATNTNNAFGSSTPSNVFGATTQQPSTFGTATTNQGNVFGMTNNNQSTGVFPGTTSNTNTFGPSSNTSFGSGFNNNNNNAQSSGINNFGSPATQPPSQTSGVFAFGGAAQSSAATPAASNAFQFGAASQTPKQSGFNFSANNSAPNINFGPGAPPAFSATPTPTFGSPVPGQFNTPSPATGMFNIGSGSTAPKQRPMIKARRRN